MKIYISGKITGDAHYKEKFGAAANVMEQVGHIALNPANNPDGLRPVDYMRICFAMMEAADAVMFLPDYKESKGAMLEYAWCEYVGKPTIFAEWEEKPNDT